MHFQHPFTLSPFHPFSLSPFLPFTLSPPPGVFSVCCDDQFQFLRSFRMASMSTVSTSGATLEERGSVS
jgi:hypothetical protein